MKFELVFDDEPGVPLTDGDLSVLGGGVRIPVAGTINGSPFRTRALRMGGWQGIRFNKDVLRAAGAEPGDAVTVEIWRDDEERVVDVPAELAEALGDLRSAYDAASYTQRKEWAQSVAAAKKPETRERRSAKVVEELRARR
jgi:antitoxin component of MazEF toxin-antitoxin module